MYNKLKKKEEVSITAFIIAIGYAALCVAIGAILYKLGVERSYSRKAVHVLVGAEWFILYHMAAPITVCAVCLILTVLLALDYRFHIISAMRSDGDNSPGTVYYGVAMTSLALASYFYPPLFLPFGIGVLCTSLGDGCAGIFGQLSGGSSKIIGSKTLVGAISNFVASFFSAFLISGLYGLELGYTEYVMIAILSVGMELISVRGLDNITVPLSVTAYTALLIAFPCFSYYALYISALPLVIAVVYGRGALDRGGTLCAAILGLASSFMGNEGFVILLTYFILALITDKMKYHGDKSGQTKKETRSAHQVLANGAIPLIASVLYFITDCQLFVSLFLLGLCESISDTAASGVGSLSARAFDIFRLRECPTGESGGVSFIGSFAAVLSAALFSLAAFLLGLVNLTDCLMVLVSALLGVAFDTLLGSLVQPRYKCSVCGRTSENSVCCAESSRLIRGVSFITNSRVNFISELFAAAVFLVLYALV